MKKILAVRFSSLGDIILSSPAILNLKIGFPEHRLVCLTKERYRGVVEMFDGVDEIRTVPDHIGGPAFTRLAWGLDRVEFDLVVDLHGNPRSWLIRKLLGASRAVVYPKRRLDRLLITRHRKTLPTIWPYTIDLYNEAVRELGAETYCYRPLLRPETASAEDESPAVPQGDYAVIAPGAAHPPKQWPTERFEEVARELVHDHHLRIVWAVTAAEAERTELASELGEAFTELVDCPIPQLARIIEQARLTLANDSGIAHLSSAVGTPTVSVFGPTHPVLGFAPRGLFDRVVQVDEFCRPCSLHGEKSCWRDRRYCFDRIPAETVLAAADRIINSGLGRHRAVFVDRDGTLIVDKDYLADPDRIEFTPGAVEALKKAQSLGLKTVIISNQSGVARGLFDLATVERVNARLLEMLTARGVEVDGLYFCPHLAQGIVPEFSYRCDCRKPHPGMAEEAALQLGLNLRRSYVVGDKLSDYNLGRAIGATSLMVRTGYGSREEQRLAAAGISSEGTMFADLARAVEAIDVMENRD